MLAWDADGNVRGGYGEDEHPLRCGARPAPLFRSSHIWNWPYVCGPRSRCFLCCIPGIWAWPYQDIGCRICTSELRFSRCEFPLCRLKRAAPALLAAFVV